MPTRKPTPSSERLERVKRWAVAFVGLMPIVAQSAWQAPFTEGEKANAESVALSYQSEPALAVRNHDQKAEHPLGQQILVVEPQELKKRANNDSKIAEVFVFNHHTHTAQLTLVDLSSNTVISSKPIVGVHLPLSDDEIAYSIDLVRQDAAVLAKLYEEHATLAHNSIEDPISGLQLRVAVWVPTTAAHANGSQCDLERCVLISLFDANNVSYAIEPVVNLKTGEVFSDLIQ